MVEGEGDDRRDNNEEGIGIKKKKKRKEMFRG